MKRIALLALAIGLLAGCDDEPAPIVQNSPVPSQQVEQPQQQPQTVYVQAEPQQQQQQPVIINQQPQYDSTGHLLTGMMLGHMMANSGGSSHTTVNRTIVKKVYVQPRRSYYGSSRSSFGSRSFSRSRRR